MFTHVTLVILIKQIEKESEVHGNDKTSCNLCWLQESHLEQLNVIVDPHGVHIWVLVFEHQHDSVSQTLFEFLGQGLTHLIFCHSHRFCTLIFQHTHKFWLFWNITFILNLLIGLYEAIFVTNASEISKKHLIFSQNSFKFNICDYNANPSGYTERSLQISGLHELFLQEFLQLILNFNSNLGLLIICNGSFRTTHLSSCLLLIFLVFSSWHFRFLSLNFGDQLGTLSFTFNFKFSKGHFWQNDRLPWLFFAFWQIWIFVPFWWRLSRRTLMLIFQKWDSLLFIIWCVWHCHGLVILLGWTILRRWIICAILARIPLLSRLIVRPIKLLTLNSIKVDWWRRFYRARTSSSIYPFAPWILQI